MMENTDFREFLSMLPAEHHANLTADNVSTPFFHARRAGWTVETLAADAASALRRGGVGLVVTRLLTLAQHPPVERRALPVKRQQHEPLPECSACGQPYQRGTHPREESECSACGAPLVLHQYAFTL